MNQKLVRQLGLFTTITIVVGAMVGSGIFRTPGGMVSDLTRIGLGTEGMLLFVWALAGFITLLGALSNAEIASMIPETGGQYVYFERMYGSFPAYLYGWSVFSVIQTGSIAAIAFVFSEYAVRFFGIPPVNVDPTFMMFHVPFIGDIQPASQLAEKIITASIVILLTWVNYLGVKFGGIVQNFFTVTKVVAMLALVIAAFALGAHEPEKVAEAATAIEPVKVGALAILLGIAGALQGAFWTYDGWNNVTYIAGEVKEPQRTIPRGLIIGIFVVIGIYLLMNLAYTWVLPMSDMASSNLVASDTASRIFPGGGEWIALLVMLSTFGTTNGTILASARVYFSMARHNVFPRFVGDVHPRFRTPSASLVLQAVWTVLLIFSGSFNTLIDTLLFVSWVFYAAGAIGLFVLRVKEPSTPRPYKVPLYPVVPAIFILFAVAYLVLTLTNDISGYIAAKEQGEPAIITSALGTALVLLGTPLYLFYHRRNRSNDSLDTFF